MRIELFGDEIESIRQFDLDAQTSVEHLDACTILLAESDKQSCPLREYIRKADVTVNVNAGYGEARVHILAAAQTADGPEDFSAAFFDHGLGEFEVGDFVVDEGRRQQFFRQLREWRAQDWRTYIFCNNEGEVERLRELVPEEEHEHVTFAIGAIARGFTFPGGKAGGAFRRGIVRPVPQHPRAAAGDAPDARAGEPRANRFQRAERRRLRASTSSTGSASSSACANSRRTGRRRRC